MLYLKSQLTENKYFKSKEFSSTSNYLPFSKASICVAVNDVLLRCNFLLRRMRNCSSASPFCPSLLLLSELEWTPSISVTYQTKHLCNML